MEARMSSDSEAHRHSHNSDNLISNLVPCSHMLLKQIPLHYGDACRPARPANQPASKGPSRYQDLTDSARATPQQNRSAK